MTEHLLSKRINHFTIIAKASSFDLKIEMSSRSKAEMVTYGPISKYYGTCVSHIYYDVVDRYSKGCIWTFPHKYMEKVDKINK